MIPVLGFTPDIDPTTPGAIVDCDNIIPTIKGISGAPSPLDVGLPALPDESKGSASMVRLDGQHRIIAGTIAGLYEATSSTFIDRSKAGGYTGGADTRWRFAQFGNATLATNGNEKIQASTSLAFADITDAPKAKIIDTASGFVMACNVNSALTGEMPDGWHCCNLYDYTTWTPSTSNQAAWGRLMDTPGEIRAGKRLGQDFVAYKERSMYLGRYIGAPIVWQWQLIASDIGAVCQEAVIDTGTAHLFIGRDDFWIFDGSKPVAIGAPLKEWFFNQLDSPMAYKIVGGFDRFNKCAWWFYPTQDSAGALNNAIIYNVSTNKWGKASIQVNSAFDYQAAETTWDEWPDAATYDDIPDYPYDSPAWDKSQPQFSIIASDKKVKALSGASVNSYVITGIFGDDAAYSTLTAVAPRFDARPTSSEMTHYTLEYSGDTATQRGTSTLNGNKYDALFSGRFHKLKFELVGDYEMTGYQPNLVQDGTA